MRWLVLMSIVSASPALAQRVIAHDTLSGETPSAVTCGFCAGERFGVIFRELPPPARGLNPSDFPVELRGVRVAVANATVSGSTCTGASFGGTGLADLAIYAGTTLPTGPIATNPETDPWPGETLVWAGESLPLTRSFVETGTTFSVSFNDLQVRDEEDEFVRVEAPNAYLRVVFTFLEEADRNPGCESMGLVSPTSFPMRDDDGVVVPERSFIFGSGGLGWQWNEAVRVNGDWAVRLELRALGDGMTDAGVDAGMDAGVDAGEADAGLDSGRDTSADASSAGGTSGGGCTVAGGTSPFAFVALLMFRRRRWAH
ncbi:MAG: hypothetical protein AAGE52_11615 [Myxococcota bacterium]